MTQDQQAAERANTVLADDKPPLPPFQTDAGDDERWSDAQLEADLLMGKSWPFFRDKSLDHLNGHHDDDGEEQRDVHER